MENLELKNIELKIKEKNANWNVRETRISQMNQNDRRKLLGVSIPDNITTPITPEVGSIFETTIEKASELLSSGPLLASEVDWRTTGNVTPVKYQGPCGSCTTFATVAVVESMASIEYGLTLDLSEGDQHFCSSHGANCDGWWPAQSFEQHQSRGTCSEECFPYNTNSICNPCSNRVESVVKITNIYSFTSVIDAKSHISTIGPVTAVMVVYEDFYHYSSGIYTHVSNIYEGLHCIEVVGYSDISKCWICKNSWSTDWGENGFFKITYGDCLIDSYDKFGANGIVLPSALISTTSTTTLRPTTTSTTTKKLTTSTTTKKLTTSTTTKKLTTSTTTKKLTTSTTTKKLTTSTTTKKLTTTTTTKKIHNIPTTITVSQDSGELIFSIISKVDWYASSNASWCKVYPEYGTGNGIIKVTFTEMKTLKYLNNNFVKDIFYYLKNTTYPDSKRNATITVVELTPGLATTNDVIITQKE